MEAIRQRLDELGKKQVGLARALGITETVMSKRLNGRLLMKASELQAAAKFLEWPVETLIDALGSNGFKADDGSKQEAEQVNGVLLAARRAKRMSQEELGAIVGVTRSAVAQWEAGTSFPEASRLVALARALELDVEELLDPRTGHNAEETSVDPEAEYYNRQFRQRLVELRQGLGWTQERMASALSLPLSTYKKYEIRSMPPMYLVPRLALISGRTLSWLLTGYG
jgi:transcriptional regulator with XRE-family HTH domain